MIFQVDVATIFDWRYLVVFLVGAIIGVFLLLMMYLSSASISFKKKRKYKRNPVIVDEKEIESLIENAQKDFSNSELRYEIGFFSYYKQINFTLVTDIAEKYHPKSKYPYLELTIDETLDLINYISDKINEQLSGRIFSQAKKLRFTMLGRYIVKKPIIEEEEKAKTNKFVGAFKDLGKWAKRKTVDKAVEFFGLRLSLKVIEIIGEETYKIYSKSVFQSPEDLTINVDELYGDI